MVMQRMSQKIVRSEGFVISASDLRRSFCIEILNNRFIKLREKKQNERKYNQLFVA